MFLFYEPAFSVESFYFVILKKKPRKYKNEQKVYPNF